MAKANTEKLIYAEAEADGGFEALAILPLHVIGPLMSSNHDQPWSWQNHIKRMMQGRPYKGGRDGRMLWNCVDVRDVARAHRLCIETTRVRMAAGTLWPRQIEVVRFLLGSFSRCLPQCFHQPLTLAVSRWKVMRQPREPMTPQERIVCWRGKNWVLEQRISKRHCVTRSIPTADWA